MTPRNIQYQPSISDRSTDYTIGSPIGFGASSVVYAAIYNPRLPEPQYPIPCALKVLDLDVLPPHSLSLLQRETQLMSLSKHPNLLRVRGSWINGHELYIALRLMNKGSAADVMRYGWPGGMEEEVVKCILKQALEGLKSVYSPSITCTRNEHPLQLLTYQWIYSS
jgi:serine/threonine-protein kinase OSR1/STK39